MSTAPIGYVGAKSAPIKSPLGQVPGTSGTCYRDRRSSSADQRTGVAHLAAAAAIALAET